MGIRSYLSFVNPLGATPFDSSTSLSPSPTSSLFNSSASSTTNAIGPADGPDAVCPADNERTVLSILWSCLTTISACAWIAVHPNIPHPKSTGRDIMMKRVYLFIWGVITPELIVLWALRQWAGVRYLMQISEKRGLEMSKKQAHLAQMGGFMLFKNEKRLGLLSITDLHRLMNGGGLVYRGIHHIPREEVKFELPSDKQLFDRSKADSLSKALVVIQTAWFTAQVISRWAQRLVVTEIELVTLSFTVLNAVVYYLWWSKPLGVRFAERVVWKTDAPDPYPGKTEMWDEPENLPLKRAFKTLPNGPFWRVIMNMFLKFKIRLINIRAQFHWTPQAGSMYASPFSAETPAHMRFPIIALSSAISMGVGALYCVGWSFTFPTPAEQTLWRVCAAFTTVAPLAVLLWALVIHVDPQARDAVSYVERRGIVVKVLTWTVFGLAPFYILTRLGLLIEALISLRALQPGALVEVVWTSFLPHL